MSMFVDEHRQDYGVEPICRMLQIAPSTGGIEERLVDMPWRVISGFWRFD